MYYSAVIGRGEVLLIVMLKNCNVHVWSGKLHTTIYVEKCRRQMVRDNIHLVPLFVV